MSVNNHQKKYGLLTINQELTKQNTNFADLTCKYHPGEEPEDKTINIRLFLKNIGTEELTLEKISPSGYISKIKIGDTKSPNLKLYPRGWAEWDNSIISIQDTIETDFILSIAKWYYGEVGFFLDIFYQDSSKKYKHEIEFKNINLQTYNFEILNRGKKTISSIPNNKQLI